MFNTLIFFFAIDLMLKLQFRKLAEPLIGLLNKVLFFIGEQANGMQNKLLRLILCAKNMDLLNQ